MPYHTRRRYLKGIGAAGAVVFAGCASDGDDGGGSDGSDGNDGSDGSGDGDDGGSTDSGQQESYKINLVSPSTKWQEEYLVYNLNGTFTGGHGWKGNLERESDGAFEVEIFRGGELGTGQDLATKIQQGEVQIGKISLANMSPFAPIADLINLPFYLGRHTDPWDLTQAWFDLTSSSPWQEQVDAKIQEEGFRPIYWTGGPARSLLATDSVGAVPQPSDMEGVTHRTPGSQILSDMWSALGANPTNIAWAETPQALQEGVAQTLHVGLPGFLFGFQDVISDISMTNIVQDDITFAMSTQWYNDLPSELQRAVDRAVNKTKTEFVEYLPTAAQRMRTYIFDNDTEIHELSEDQIDQFAEVISWEKSMWNNYKQEFAGSNEEARQLRKGLEHDSKYQIPDF